VLERRLIAALRQWVGPRRTDVRDRLLGGDARLEQRLLSDRSQLLR
jgi:hypothetical protein